MDDFKRRKVFLAIATWSLLFTALGLSRISNAETSGSAIQPYASNDSVLESNLETALEGLSKNHWLPSEPQTAKIWLSYSENYAIKRVIDFGKEQVKISYQGAYLVDSSPSALKYNVERFLQITVAEAYRLAGVEPGLMVQPKHMNRSLLNLSHAQASRLYFGAVINRSKDEVLTITIKLPDDSLKKRAEIIQPVIDKLAQAEQVSAALVMAILHEENAFNFLPNAASRDRANDIEVDIDIERNIKQLALLNQQFSAIENDESRELCVIAAYRVGVNEVVRIFTGRTSLSQALPLINQLSSRQVRGQLRSQLSVKGGGEYVQQVTSFLALYD